MFKQGRLCLCTHMLDIHVAFLYKTAEHKEPFLETTTLQLALYSALICCQLLLTYSLQQTDLYVSGSSRRAYMNTHRRASWGSKVLSYFARSGARCCLRKSSSSQWCHCTRRLTMIQVQQHCRRQREANRCRHE